METTKLVPLVRQPAQASPLVTPTGIRRDARTIDEFRQLSLRLGAVPKAAGSACLELQDTKVVCSVFGPQQTEGKDYLQRGQLECTLRFTSFAQRERRRPVQGGAPDEKSFSSSLAAALIGSVQLEQYPKSTIVLSVLVLQDGGGVLPAAITCASLALADAGIRLYDMVASCCCGFVEGSLVLDPSSTELRVSSSESLVALMPSLNQLTLLQQDGASSFEQTTQSLQLALDGCAKLHERMCSTLRAKAQAQAAQAQGQAQPSNEEAAAATTV